MKKIIVSFSSLPTITQGTSPTHRPIFAYRKPFRIAICFVIDVEIKFHPYHSMHDVNVSK